MITPGKVRISGYLQSLLNNNALKVNLMTLSEKKEGKSKSWWIDLLLVVILLIGAYFRFTGMNWDQGFHLHPDERFLSMVESAISPVESLKDYFNTENSSLNPHNRGHGFFVYGTLPIFIVRYLAEWLHQTGYDEVTMLGRAYSASVDLMTVILVFLTALRIYKKQNFALLAAAFYAMAVLPIQLSHYWTVDTSTNFFGMMAIYLVVRIATSRQNVSINREIQTESSTPFYPGILRNWDGFLTYAFFGVALGMATASKVNAGLLAFLLPLAAYTSYTNLSPDGRLQQKWLTLRNLALAGIISLVVFRIFQPYAFSGPGFFDITPNPKWVGNLKELSALSAGDSTYPPGVQWARRPLTFAWQNMVVWGLGIPLGLAAWASFLWMGWKILRGEWKSHILLWSWTAVYFSWQSINFTRSMRYQMLVYPTLVIIAAWGLIEFWKIGREKWDKAKSRLEKILKPLANITLIVVLSGTGLWAYAFTGIYNRPITRLAASEWIYQNVPGPINLRIQTSQGQINQPLSYPLGTTITSDRIIKLAFTPKFSGLITNVNFSHIRDNALSPKTLELRVTDPSQNPELSVFGRISSEFAVTGDSRGEAYQLILDNPMVVDAGKTYHLELSIPEPDRELVVTGPMWINMIQTDKKNDVLISGDDIQLRSGDTYTSTFTSTISGELFGFTFSHIQDPALNPVSKTLLVTVSDMTGGTSETVSGTIANEFPGSDDPRGASFHLYLDRPLQVFEGNTYLFEYRVLEPGSELSISGPTYIQVSGSGSYEFQPLPEPVQLLRPRESYSIRFLPLADGKLSEVTIGRIVDWEGITESKTLEISIESILENGSFEIIGNGAYTGDFLAKSDPRGESISIKLNADVFLSKDKPYTLTINFKEGSGSLAIYGSRQANESSWDDPLPYGMFGYSPFDYNNGVYRTDLNFEMYWDDNQDKYLRITSTLDQTDYIFISSNRQWGSVTRIPERYPLTTTFYRQLIGCPAEKDLYWCFATAKPGDFTGTLGFDLIKTFDSNPHLGSLEFNTQFAEEAFTVYDHPKVLIFKKSEGYDSNSVKEILGAVDLDHVIDLTPKTASSFKGDLTLPEDRLAEQRAGGTWAELFNTESVINRYPLVTVIIWYLSISLLGWVFYPTVRNVFKGFKDRGYPLTKLFGLLVLAFVVWMAGSFGISFSRITITLVFLILMIMNVVIAYKQRDEIKAEIFDNWKRYLAVELFSAIFFLFFLLIRLGNPDLWHPSKGGEKPMDFSYFNAILKSTTFPPYDPWYAGGYINYYYYGFVILGVPVKLLGIVPATAYNILLPTLFMLSASVAFSIGWNLSNYFIPSSIKNHQFGSFKDLFMETPFISGCVSAISILILGNLGTVRMLWHGLQKLAAEGVSIDSVGFFQRLVWTFKGLGKVLTGSSFPYGPGDWYWIPSRVFPNEPITEFPFFTFLYADLHAHLISLMITLLVIAWAINLLMGKWQWAGSTGKHGWLSYLLTMITGGLIIGALRPTNTWDLPTYLIFAVAVVFYTSMKYATPPEKMLPGLSLPIKRFLIASVSSIVLIGLSFLLYQPFGEWFGQAYNKVNLWKGDRSPFWSYLTHWGLFFFVIISWMIHELLEWLAQTPASALQKLKPWRELIYLGTVITFGVIIGAVILGIQIAWLAILMALLALALIFRPGQSDQKRLVLFMIGTGLALTLAVELFVIEGDIGRMNTVFKFYLQAWTMLSLSAAACFIWLVPVIKEQWGNRIRTLWQVTLVLLTGGALLFPWLAGADKIRDRMNTLAPHTLDGMKYMETAHYSDYDKDMDLGQDYRAIRWMQENIIGSPVIVEANTPEYRWGSRYTIYTGLPGVVGWNWHQRQQRAVVNSDWVQERVNEVGEFFSTADTGQAIEFIRKYDVKYIIVGQLERAAYPAEGIAKFSEQNGVLWREIYRESETVIYEVVD